MGGGWLGRGCRRGYFWDGGVNRIGGHRGAGGGGALRHAGGDGNMVPDHSLRFLKLECDV